MLFEAQDSIAGGGKGHGVYFLLLKREDVAGIHYMPVLLSALLWGRTGGSWIVNLP